MGSSNFPRRDRFGSPAGARRYSSFDGIRLIASIFGYCPVVGAECRARFKKKRSTIPGMSSLEPKSTT